jgi:hypothetical protein
VSIEVLEGVESREYYTNKISSIKQDIKDNENGIKSLYNKKSDLILGWAKCLDELGDIPTEQICTTIVNELIFMDCKRGVSHVYTVLPDKYKAHDKAELGLLGADARWDKEEKSTIDSLLNNSRDFVKLPNEIINLNTAPPEDLQQNQEFLAGQIKELKRREQEYTNTMRDRHIARVSNQKDADIESTPRPYDPVKGHFYKSMQGLSEDLQEASDTCSDIADKIEYYPPETEAEDKKLAEGVEAWRTLFQWFNEHLRPYADLKFSQTYPDWWYTEELNRDYGKHAAAVKSKIATLSGGFRSLTREQVGDKSVDLAEKALHFKGMLELANKAFGFLQKDAPSYHKRRMAPSVATRKENVGPKLSESAFGSSKDL